MAESTKPGAKTVKFDNVGAFLNDAGDITLAFRGPNGFNMITTVNNREGSRRYHPHLFDGLSEALRRNGLPAPDGRAATPIRVQRLSAPDWAGAFAVMRSRLDHAMEVLAETLRSAERLQQLAKEDADDRGSAAEQPTPAE